MKQSRVKRIRTPMSYRSDAGERIYQTAKLKGETIPLSEEPSIIDYRYWRLIENRYPGDTLYDTHDMLVPKRIFALRGEMTLDELIEKESILKELDTHYHEITENTEVRRSVKGHYHIHLKRFYMDRKDRKL